MNCTASIQSSSLDYNVMRNVNRIIETFVIVFRDLLNNKLCTNLIGGLNLFKFQGS